MKITLKVAKQNGSSALKLAARLLPLFLAVTSLQAQKGALGVNVQGSIFDRREPPGPVVAVSEPTAAGVKVMISRDSSVGFNVAVFADDPQLRLFKNYPYAGVALEMDGVRIPENAFAFFGSVQDTNLVGDLYLFSGTVHTTDDKQGPRDILYAGSYDNPIVLDKVSGPLYSWDFMEDGVAGNGSNFACVPAEGVSVPRGFVVVVERGQCLFWTKAQNAARAGAAAVIVYNHEEGGNTLIFNMATPGVSIPSVFVKRSDGLALLKHANDYPTAPAKVEMLPTNLLGTIFGTYRTGADGTLEGVNLNLVISTQWETLFAGTLTR